MIRFVDLNAQYHTIQDEIQAALHDVLSSGQFVLGTAVEAFERDFAAYCHTAFAVGVNSGTSALHLALLAAGVGPGDEVITVPFTFVATVAAIEYAGATPVLVDIDPRTCCMDAAQLEAAITPRTKAVIPVHLYGQPADMRPILEIARHHNLIVIEDAAQAHGAIYHGQRVGSLGDLACFSFYPAKNLGAYGEAGAVVTSNAEYARTLRMLRDWGQEGKHQHVLKGFNYRMSALQGAILGVKLRHLEGWVAARRAHAQHYQSLLADTGLQLPTPPDDTQHAYHLYVMRTPDRDRLRAALAAQDIPTGIHYPYAIHQLPAYHTLGYADGTFPHAEHAAREVLSLPMYAELPPEHIDQIAHVLKSLAQ